VGGTAQKPSLTLRSEPELEQADILAVLLFGKPTTALGQGEKMDLQQQALKVTSGYAAAKIGESVSQALGLEELGIDLREVDFTGGSIGFGRYVAPNTYVSVSQDIAGKKAREVSVEYSMSRQWKVTTSTSASGNNEAGIVWHKEY
jgi:translocation and assembly module TamB